MFYGSFVTFLFGSKTRFEKKKEDIQKFSLHDFQSVQNFIILETYSKYIYIGIGKYRLSALTAILISDIGISQNFHIGASLIEIVTVCLSVPPL